MNRTTNRTKRANRSLRFCAIVLMAVVLSVCPATSCGEATATAESKLEATIEVSPMLTSGEAVKLAFALTNNMATRLHVLKWYTPLEGIAGEIFRVESDGQVIPYQGILATRTVPSSEAYVLLEPGESASAEVDLATAYDFSKVGEYTIEFISPKISHVARTETEMAQRLEDLGPVQIPSNSVTVEIASEPGGPTVSPLSLDPHDNVARFVVLPAIAGLMVLVGMVIVAVVPEPRKESDTQSQDTKPAEDSGHARVDSAKPRYGILVVTFWIALSGFLILDLAGSISLHLGLTVAYDAIWVLIGALLLRDSSARRKVLILSLFVIAVFCVRFVDWNSRKPFLKDLYTIREGMTPTQVEEIMGRYTVGGGQTESAERGEIVAGSISYRHTQEAWGNSDWGTVTFESGRVVNVDFSPD